MNREVAASERVCLECNQFVRSLQNASPSSAAFSAKMLNNLTERVSARLSPSLLKLYTEGYDPEAAASAMSDGMRVLESLRDAQNLLNLVVPLAHALIDTGKTG